MPALQIGMQAKGKRRLGLSPALTYLISFFPKRVIATVSTNAKIKIADGKNGNRVNPVLTPFAVKSCKEQETKYPL